MPNDAPKLPVYRLGEGYPITQEGKPLYSWPYTVDYAPGHPSGDFYLGEGDARNGQGSFLHAGQVLQPQWRRHLETAGVPWLLPLLERMARGEAVSPAEFLDAYRSVHGNPPPAEEWPLR